MLRFFMASYPWLQPLRAVASDVEKRSPRFFIAAIILAAAIQVVAAQC
ncbi:hypothetical protein PC1_1761 [Pectobacterium carotovorum subsp. carotovorum PC1]|uniref:Uncharacterized protein n=1 Tax=Pectobacterium carotovorum subsp. carotovorum (strain PC1) TaxID=561230 RepID=C6DF93_PECCP|nr:hypothetical protein PC1_1761 [Pectobacterium carotovorum subsp. carotovorum PC1]